VSMGVTGAARMMVGAAVCLGLLGLPARIAGAAATDPSPLSEAPDLEDYQLTLAGTAAVLAGGLAWYWLNAEGNKKDWVLAWDVPSWRRKLNFDAVRFDENAYRVNFAHAPVGALYYLAARGNHLSPMLSLANTFVASIVWEYFIEFRELVAINDLVMNMGGGWALGEPFYRLSELFARSEPTWWNEAAAAVLSPFGAANRGLRGRRPIPDPVDAYGLSATLVHRLRLAVGADLVGVERQAAAWETSLAAETEVIAIPASLRPGAFVRWAGPGTWSSFAGTLAIGPGGRVSGQRLDTRVLVVGRFGQDLASTADDQQRGHAWMLGLGSAFRHLARELPGLKDRITTVGVLGPWLELLFAQDGLRLRFSALATGDFAMVDAHALGEGATFDPSRLTSSLHDHGYYYATGGTGTARVRLTWRGVCDLVVEARGGRYWAISGRDPEQEQLHDQLAIFDSRSMMRVGLGYRPPIRWLRIELGGEWVWRSGRIGVVSHETGERLVSLALALGR
jgi:hypothetical protein